MDILDILLDILLKPPQPFIGLFLELGMGNSEIGIEYGTGNDHKFVWHIET